MLSYPASQADSGVVLQRILEVVFARRKHGYVRLLTGSVFVPESLAHNIVLNSLTFT